MKAAQVDGAGMRITTRILAARMGISYGRASALIDQLEAEGNIRKEANGTRRVV